MGALNFVCPFCQASDHSYTELMEEADRRSVAHDCSGVKKRSYVFVDQHTSQGVPIYLRCDPPSPASE